jgi:hypothetical protein
MFLGKTHKATSLVKIVSQLEKVDKITGFPENILLGYSDTLSASERLARYLFCRNYAKGLILVLPQVHVMDQVYSL